MDPVIPNIIHQTPTNVFECINIVLQDNIKEEIKEIDLETSGTAKSVCNASVFKNMTTSSSCSENKHGIISGGFIKVEANSQILDNEMETSKSDLSPSSGVNDFIKDVKSEHQNNKRKTKLKRSRCTCSFCTNHTLVNGKEHHKCDIPGCDKIFKMERGLAYHSKIHTGEKPYMCELCNLTFNRPDLLSRHKLKHNEKQFSCYICNKSFYRKCSLTAHMKTHLELKRDNSSDFNLDKKPYECAECGYKCLLEAYWIKHTKPDLTEELKSCEFCKQQYSRRACLLTHIRLKSHSKRKKIEQSHQCNFCDKKFKHSNNLKVHIRTHTGEKPYECSECHKTFSAKNWLMEHILTHKPATKFPCQFCDKKFRRKTQYLIHLNTHTREKIYKCFKCDKEFLVKGSFKRHMRGHTEEKLREKSPTSSQQTELKLCDSTDEIIEQTANIKVENIDLEETAIMEYATTETVKTEKIGSSSLPYNICFEERICKEELILPTESIYE